MTTLEFLQHHFSFISTTEQPALHYLTRSVRRTRGFVLTRNPDKAPDHGRVADHPGIADFPAFRPGSGWGTCRAPFVHFKEVGYQAVKYVGPLKINGMPGLGNGFQFGSRNKFCKGSRLRRRKNRVLHARDE